MLIINNTLSAKKEPFKPWYPHKVMLYVCGITPYDYSHVGHARVYVIFDLLYRLLIFLDYTVIYCRNFTDIDDKLLNKAIQEYGDQKQFLTIANQFIAAYQEDMVALNCLAPTFQPRVTEHIPEIIALIKKLVDTNKAYVVDGDVYFSIETFPDYGHLSKQKLEDLHVGARIEQNPKKRSALDFALWKGEAEGTFWKSPWGYGRPGWHIECSALARHFLGEHIDIHGGGMDLIFPHHENEIAQSESIWGKPFARYWMHNAFVRINKEKMSKSLKNFFTIRDIFEQCDPMVLRYMILTHHYRSPLDFSLEDLQTAQKAYQKLALFFSKIDCLVTITLDQVKQSEIVIKMVEFLADDLNTPGMFGVLFENLKKMPSEQACLVKKFFNEVLGLTLKPLSENEVIITPEIERLIAEREQARANKDYKKSDELRDKLKLLGYEVQDARATARE